MSTNTPLAIQPLSPLHQQMQQWRREIHQYPETAYEEFLTSDKVAEILGSLGLTVDRGLGGTGVVGLLEGELGEGPMIGLRADMDALHLNELNQFEHRSCHEGKMHGCGHDGHTAMLLGAASHLSRNRQFRGSICFIFQPAEEGHAGARKMIEDGMFERFPMDQVYGMHNWPGLEQGRFAVHPGAVMASADTFTISITGQGGHAAMPHQGVDPVLVAGQIISASQSIVSRNINPLESGVISITQMEGGDTHNVIPEQATLKGTVRTLAPEQRELIQQRLRTLVENIAAGFGAQAELIYRDGYPATINTPDNAEQCRRVAASLAGDENVDWAIAPSMGAEDFAFMLQQKPGAYIWIGNGAGPDCCALHNPHYDFNDEILPLGASYWVALSYQLLS
ncbi:M20 aminoacylase family protein [Marinobacterium jannaschii]|uniref:M20 aminoacylase family protein n=1 Tax=Marinobacterium jannaschii TaxID=64970 RepID=UPI0009FD071B|nr:M20 aminoacylase family protein [Marinobacterium jannaschii]